MTVRERVGEPNLPDPLQQAKDEVHALTAPREPDPEQIAYDDERLRERTLLAQAWNESDAVREFDYDKSLMLDREAAGGPETAPDARKTLATLWHIPFIEPPPLLLDPWLHPEAATILYAPGGTGKGLTMAWLALRAVREANLRPYILDYEYHPAEWKKRLTFLGATEEEQRSIVYRAPYSGKEEFWAGPAGSLHVVADLIKDDLTSTGCDLLFVDSYTTATSGDAAMGGEAGAREFFLALSGIGKPALVAAHVKKTDEKHPKYPFGSVFIHNLARRTWSVEALPVEEPATGVVSLDTVVRLHFRNQKHSDTRGAVDQYVTFTISEVAKVIKVAEETDRGVTLANVIWNTLTEPMTLKTLREALIEDGEEPVSERTLSKTMEREPRKFIQIRTGKRPFKWDRHP